jgi:hypothetical protein
MDAPRQDLPPLPLGHTGCGSCSLCCTVMKVELPEGDKPEGQPCQHLCSSGCGCSIYASRPAPCRDFECVWLVSQRVPEVAMPAALRPDRVGVAMEVNSAGTLIAHCKYPGSWKRPGIREWLIEQTSRAIVLLDCGPDSAWLLKPDGSTDPVFFIGIDPITNNRLYGHIGGGKGHEHSMPEVVDRPASAPALG